MAITIFEIFPRQIFSLFTTDEALLAEGTRAMKIILSMMWLLGISISSTGIHQAMGKPRAAFLLAILRWVLLVVPLIFILPNIGGMGLDGIWLAFPVADVLAAVISVAVLIQTLRKSRIKTRFTLTTPFRNRSLF